jgi:HAD superfamily phosphoserine phosphatase-like hydrolase
MSKTLVLFDFDGTLTKKDTFFQFLCFSKGASSVIMMFLGNLHSILFYFVRLISAEELKRRLFNYHFKGSNKAELETTGDLFSIYMNKTASFRKDIMEKLNTYKRESADIYVVSASIGIWVHPICKSLGINAICTEIEFEAMVFNGKFATKNCNGIEKANRIRAEVDLKAYSKIIAYGNSKGDKEMLAMANDAFMV